MIIAINLVVDKQDRLSFEACSLANACLWVIIRINFATFQNARLKEKICEIRRFTIFIAIVFEEKKGFIHTLTADAFIEHINFTL